MKIEQVNYRRPPEHPSAADQVLHTPIRLGPSSDAQGARASEEMDRTYFAPSPDTAAPMQLYVDVDGTTFNIITSPPPGDTRPPECGTQLRARLISMIATHLVAAKVSPLLAHAQATDIADLLGSPQFLALDKPLQALASDGAKHKVHQQALHVSIQGTQICLHKTTTFRAAAGGGAVTKVVDLCVTILSTGNRFSGGDSRRLEAKVTQTGVSFADEGERDGQLQAFGASASSAPWAPPNKYLAAIRRVLEHLSTLCGYRGMEYVVSTEQELAALGARRRPELTLEGLSHFDKKAHLMTVLPTHGPWSNGGATYRDRGSVVTRHRTRVDPETPYEAYKRRGEATGQQYLAELQEKETLSIGLSWFRGPNALPRSTYRYAEAGLVDAAQATLASPQDPQTVLKARLGDVLFHHYGSTGGGGIILNGRGIPEELRGCAKELYGAQQAIAKGAPPNGDEVQGWLRGADKAARDYARPLWEVNASLDTKIEAVKAKLIEPLYDALARAGLDAEMQLQVLTVLAFGGDATRAAFALHGAPQFENTLLESRVINLGTQASTPGRSDGTIVVEFATRHQGLGEFDEFGTIGELGTVKLGGQSFTARDQSSVADSYSVATWEIRRPKASSGQRVHGTHAGPPDPALPGTWAHLTQARYVAKFARLDLVAEETENANPPLRSL